MPFNFFLSFVSLWIIIVLCIEEGLSARIVATGVPGGNSHDFVNEKIGRALVAKGHEFIQFVAKHEEPVFSKKLKLNSGKVKYYDCAATQDELDNLMHEIGQQNPWESATNFATVTYRVCEKFITDPEVLAVFEEGPVDILFFDTAFVCPVILAEKYNITKKVSISNVGFLDPLLSHVFGFSVPLAWIPLMKLPFSDHMNLFQRMINTAVYEASVLINDDIQYRFALPFYQRHGGQHNSIAEIARHSLLLVQGGWGLDFPRDLPPNIKFIGSVMSENAKPLNAEYKEWMDNATEGVIVASFGSIVHPSEADNQLLLKTFAKLPFRVLWKLRKDHRIGIDVIPPNVRIEEWIPQNDLFGHPNTKVFITHCGMNSMLESIHSGIPMLGFPKFADQFPNCKQLAEAKVGQCIFKNNKHTPDTLATILKELATNPIYRENTLRLGAIMKEYGGADEVVKWIEYTLRHGYDHLIPFYEFEIPWYQRWLLDVVFFYALIAAALVATLSFCTYLCVCKITKTGRYKEVKIE